MITEVFAILFPIFLFIAIGTIAFKAQNSFLKPLTQTFGSSSRMPNTTVRPTEVRFGSLRIRNAANVGEEGNSIFLKFPLGKVIQIPYSAFSDLKASEGFLDGFSVVATFKRAEISPLTFELTQNEFDSLPILKSKISAAANSKEIHKNATVAKDIGKVKFAPTEVLPPSVSMPQIKSSLGNLVRGILVAILLVILAAYLVQHYGL